MGPGGRDRVFQLKMAPGGGQSRRGILECVHQELKDDNKHQVSSLSLSLSLSLTHIHVYILPVHYWLLKYIAEVVMIKWVLSYMYYAVSGFRNQLNWPY